MPNKKIQKSGYGSTRALIKAATVEDKEPIWNLDLKELLVKYSTGVGWFEIPSEERLYTGATSPARNTVGDQVSGDYFIGVKDDFTNIDGDTHLHNVLISVDTELGNRINKDGSVNVEEQLTFEKNIIVGESSGNLQINNSDLDTYGDSSTVYGLSKNLIFNGDFDNGEYPEFGWSIDTGTYLSIEDGYVKFYADDSGGHYDYLRQTVNLSAGTYLFEYNITANSVSFTTLTVCDISLDSITEGTHSQYITLTEDKTEFVLYFNSSSLNGTLKITDLSFKKSNLELLTNGDFETLPPTDNWELGGGELTFITNTNTFLQFLPTGKTSVFIKTKDPLDIESNKWYEFEYDVLDNTDINSEISAYIQTNTAPIDAIKIDLSEGTNKKILFKTPVGTTDWFQVIFVCNNDSTPTSKIEIDNFSLRKANHGDAYVGKNIRIGGDITVEGEISQANIQGFLNLKPSSVEFTSASFEMVNYTDVLNSVYVLCTDDGNQGLEEYLSLNLPTVASDNMLGRFYIIVNSSSKPIRVTPAGSEYIGYNTYAAISVNEAIGIIAYTDQNSIGKEEWLAFKIPNGYFPYYLPA